MDIFGVLSLVGGLALFLYGMNVMGSGLEKLSGGKLEGILGRLTSSPLKAVLLGAGVTAVIQSSSATTVMVVGFVNSGIMKLSQAIGIIMGANIGTTITSWILSLSGIEGSNFFIQMLKPSSFSPIFALVGIILLMSGKSGKKKDIGGILLGFAVLMFGMQGMSDAVKPLADVPEFTRILIMFSNPLLGVLAGAVLTAVIQSSSASVGILQALSVTGALPYATVLPIIMGQNIGTCVTAMLSSIGASKNAKRAAIVHLYFNIIGTILFMVIFYVVNAIIGFAFVNDASSGAGIAVLHSVFNIFATLILLPFTKILEKLAYMTIKDEANEDSIENLGEEFQLLDSRFLSTPGFAIEQCKTVAVRMAELSKETLMLSISLFDKYNEESTNEVLKYEDIIDQYEDHLGSYLVQLSTKNLSEKDSQSISVLLHCLGDFERISDHAVNLSEAAKEMAKKELEFSNKAREELTIFRGALSEILEKTILAFTTNDLELAKTVEPLEEVIDQLNHEMKKRHIKRLRKGKCTIELGFVLSDVTTNFERVADHCSNIAVCMIQAQENSMDIHEYLNELKVEENKDFEEQYREYREKYLLP